MDCTNYVGPKFLFKSLQSSDCKEKSSNNWKEEGKTGNEIRSTRASHMIRLLFLVVGRKML